MSTNGIQQSEKSFLLNEIDTHKFVSSDVGHFSLKLQCITYAFQSTIFYFEGITFIFFIYFAFHVFKDLHNIFYSSRL